MRLQRGLIRGLRLAGTVVQAALDHAIALRKPSLQARAEWLHYWCGMTLDRVGVDFAYSGTAPTNHLLVANHLSYLDIFLLSAITQCVRGEEGCCRLAGFWPDARLAGTIFVDRERRADVHRASDEVHAAASAGVLVVIFPEGTSSDGRTVLPFYSSLFEPAVRLALPIASAHLSYELEDGNTETEICYWGTMTLVPHLAHLLSKDGIRARVCFGKPHVYTDRKHAALSTRREVLELSGSFDPHSDPASTQSHGPATPDFSSMPRS